VEAVSQKPQRLGVLAKGADAVSLFEEAAHHGLRTLCVQQLSGGRTALYPKLSQKASDHGGYATGILSDAVCKIQE
jgi:hypothetical protein